MSCFSACFTLWLRVGEIRAEMFFDFGIGEGETLRDKLHGICLWNSDDGELSYRGTFQDNKPEGYGKQITFA